MTKHRYPGLRRYALSILTIGAAVLLSWPLHPLQDITMPLLSLVRGLVEAHGGSVNARSDGIGAGSEIVVRLPAMEAAVPA